METRYFLFLPLLMSLGTASTLAVADQICDAAYPMSIQAGRFKDNGDGTLTDSQSGLTWMRCALGQNWAGATCVGKLDTYTWQSAQDMASKLDKMGGYAGHNDWRVPQIPELAMIVERQCANPRINLALFPTTPATYFWTATTRRGRGMEAEAYVLSFGPEGAGHKDKGDAHYVRLVRDGK